MEFVYCARERDSTRESERNERKAERSRQAGWWKRVRERAKGCDSAGGGGDGAKGGWVENDDHHTQSGT